MALADPERGSSRDALLAGGTSGLALSSKGTAYVFCTPLMALLLFRRFRAAGLRSAAVHAGAMAALAFLTRLAAPAASRRAHAAVER
jgi:hypothetical protein